MHAVFALRTLNQVRLQKAYRFVVINFILIALRHGMKQVFPTNVHEI